VRTLMKSSTCHVVLEEPWIFINRKKFGFKMTDDEGVNRIVVHKKMIERFAKEFGFLVPTVLIRCSMLFEITVKEDLYTHYHYYPKLKNRLIETGDHTFIGLGRLEVITPAEHIKKVKVR